LLLFIHRRIIIIIIIYIIIIHYYYTVLFIIIIIIIIILLFIIKGKNDFLLLIKAFSLHFKVSFTFSICTFLDDNSKINVAQIKL